MSVASTRAESSTSPGTIDAEMPGTTDSTYPTAPATAGAAIDVPLSTAYWPPRVSVTGGLAAKAAGTELRMPVPGASTSRPKPPWENGDTAPSGRLLPTTSSGTDRSGMPRRCASCRRPDTNSLTSSTGRSIRPGAGVAPLGAGQVVSAPFTSQKRWLELPAATTTTTLRVMACWSDDDAIVPRARMSAR